LLTKEGIVSFVPGTRWEESFCESKEELNEYRENQILEKRREIWPNEELLKQIKKLREENRLRKERSGNLWDGYSTRCERRCRKLESTDLKRWFNIKDVYDLEAERLWQQELWRFSLGFADVTHARSRRPQTNIGIYKNVLGGGLAEFGFEIDNELKSPDFFIYKKEITSHFKICWAVDVVNLREPFDLKPVVVSYPGTGVRRVSKPLGAPLYITLWVYPTKIIKKIAPPVYFSFSCLFPIGGRYRHFKSVDELEVLANIYLTMYRLIRADLEVAVIKSVESYRNRGAYT